MATQLSARSDFTETMAIHLALKAALKSKLYAGNAAVRKAAVSLCNRLESDRSIYGRQLKMLQMMEKGASLAEIGRKLRCSRRTVFRYLNALEEAGIPITLEGTVYRVDQNVSRMLKV